MVVQTVVLIPILTDKPKESSRISGRPVGGRAFPSLLARSQIDCAFRDTYIVRQTLVIDWSQQ